MPTAPSLSPCLVAADRARRMTAKQRHLLEYLNHTLSNDPELHRHISNLLDPSQATMSGRLLYWVATNFSKSSGLYIVKESLTTNVWDSYNARLKEWNRHSFDPFCRRGSPAVKLRPPQTNEAAAEGTTPSTTQALESSLAQVHFLYWAVCTGVTEYTSRNLERIGIHQEDAMRRVRERKASGHVKRSQISPPRKIGAVGFPHCHDPRAF